jgi:GntR family transcriptional regulator
MDSIDPNNAQPLYKQLYQVILKAIEDGIYRPGDKIPSEEALQEQFGVSRVTVRGALSLLVDDEILLRIHGKGTFVAEGRFAESVFTGGSFTDTCLRMNAKPETRIVSREIQAAKRKIAEKLEIKPGENIIYIQRLRLVNGVACILEQDYCPLSLDFLLNVELENKSIFGLLRENLGVLPACFEDRYEVWYASKKEAVLLGCDPGYPLLRVDEIITVRGGGVLYYNEQLIRSDRYTYANRYQAVISD